LDQYPYPIAHDSGAEERSLWGRVPEASRKRVPGSSPKEEPESRQSKEEPESGLDSGDVKRAEEVVLHIAGSSGAPDVTLKTRSVQKWAAVRAVSTSQKYSL
jgi:hypothetical protein